MLRQINDPWVLRILINQAHIERQILADKRWEAEKTLKALRGGGNAWSLDGFGVRVFPYVCSSCSIYKHKLISYLQGGRQ